MRHGASWGAAADDLGRVTILGTGVDPVTKAEALDRAEALIRRGEPAQVVTINPELVMHAQRDPAVAAALARAALVVPDGIGIVWAARLLGRPVPERVPGIEFAEGLLHRAAVLGYRVFLLGAAPGVAEEAARRLAARCPGLMVAGTHHGYFRPEDEAAVVEAIRRAQPHILLVALGAPRQELWIARHLEACRVPLAVGVGGSLDVFAGRVRRAPVWMQQVGLEWLYRLVRQPARAGRMLALPQFALRVLLDVARRNLL
ncbi:MAG TPA: WecB/TagA/CpsF family glycosyltransferase [Limnochordales bacterium]